MRMAKCKITCEVAITTPGKGDAETTLYRKMFEAGAVYDVDHYGLKPATIRAYFEEPELAPPQTQTRDLGGKGGTS